MMAKVVKVELLTSWEIGGLHLRIVGHPFSKDEFRLLKRKELVWGLFGELACENELPPGWYITTEYEELEKLGFTFEDDVKRKIDEYRLERKRMAEMQEIAENMDIRCPVCNKKLVVGQWSGERAILRCYEHGYTAVVNRDGIIDAGFDEEKNEEYGVSFGWDALLFRLGDVEKAKIYSMKRTPSLGVCLICQKILKTPGELLKHLKEHGCDV